MQVYSRFSINGESECWAPLFLLRILMLRLIQVISVISPVITTNSLSLVDEIKHMIY